LQGEASKMALNNKRYDSVNVDFGRYGNQVSAGTIEPLWPTRKKNACVLSAKNETQQRSAELKNINAQQKGNKKLSYAWKDHVLNINLCVKFVILLIFTEIQRKGIRLFNKSNRVSFMYLRFVYVSMEL